MTSVNRSVELLQHLIRNSCVNDGDRGNEIPNADAIAGLVDLPGVELEVLDSEPGRRSVIARWRGTDPTAPTTMLLSHTDVVPADASTWEQDPFGGELIGNEIWGRGAVDMLCHAATMAYSFADLATSGRRLPGDLVLAAVADEEAMGVKGSQWLLENHPDVMSADWVLTEGGGVSMGPQQVSVLIADKGAWRVELVVNGESGHSSMPWGITSAVMIAAEVIRRLTETPISAVFTEPWQIAMSRASDGPGEADSPTTEQWHAMLATLPAGVARAVHAATHMTIAPTSVSTEGSWNSLVPQVRIGLDVRTLVGQSWTDVHAELQSMLGSLAERVEIIAVAGSSASFSPIETPLWNHIDHVTRSLLHDSNIAPMMGGMTTDARFFRERGALAYGVGLMNPVITPPEVAQMVHGNDERIDLESIDLLSKFWDAIINELA